MNQFDEDEQKDFELSEDDEFNEYDEMELLERLETLREDMEDLRVTTLAEVIRRIEKLHSRLDQK